MHSKIKNKISVTKCIFLLYIFVFAPVTTIKSQSVGGTTSGANSYCTTSNSGFISVNGYTGNITGWQSSIDGGTTWSNVPNITAAQSYNNLTQSTCFRAVVQNGAFPADTSTISCITIYPPTVPGTITGGGTFCGGSGNGTLNLSGNTGSVLSWQFSTDGGTSWTSVSNTTTTLNYTNITQNTLYEAVVQNTSFCLVDSSAPATFTIVPNTVAGSISTNKDTLCYKLNRDTLNLSGNVGNVLGWISSTDSGTTWSPIANTTTSNINFGLTQTTWYAAIVQNATCSIDTTATMIITVLTPGAVSAGTDTTIAPGQSVTLNGSGNGTPFWIPSTGLSNPAILNPTATPSVTSSYILTVTDTNLCINADTVVITVMSPVFNGMISSLFTPNGDGINDNWYIENAISYPDNEVAVYNIYGNEVFSKKAYQNDWQGTYNGASLPDGTYFYVVKMDSSGKIFQGSLDILRKK